MQEVRGSIPLSSTSCAASVHRPVIPSKLMFAASVFWFPSLRLAAEGSSEGNGPANYLFSFIVGGIILVVAAFLVAAWISNIFGLVRAIRTNQTALAVTHALGIVVGLLGSVMGAIYFFKWRHEPLVVPGQGTSNLGVPNIAEELGKLASLRDQGVITDVEFEVQKGKLLGH